jgi:phosphoribosylglycinamide formyltransferase 1
MKKKKLKYQEILSGKKIKTCIFISGHGSNLSSLINYSRNYNFPIKISLVISNNKSSKGLLLAKKYGIPNKFFPSDDSKKFERKCLLELKRSNIKFLCLAGFMSILSKNFINNFKYKIVNIHPSLLPKYKGLNTHMRVLKNNEKYSGCTVHFVSNKLDSGKIVLQKKVLINPTETEKSLKLKILKKEHDLYAQSIINIFK